MKKFLLLCIVVTLLFSFWWFRVGVDESKDLPTKQQPSDELIVGINAEFPPFTFYKNDQIVGFDIDIVNEIGKRINKRIVLKDLPFDALIPEIQLGTIQVIAAGMNPTEDRAQRVFFTHEVYQSDPLVIVSPKNTPLTSITELNGKSVLVNEGYFADSYLSQHPQIGLTRLSTAFVTDGLLALQNMRAEAFVATYATLVPYMTDEQKRLFNITLLHEITDKDALAVSKKYPELFQEIQDAIMRMKQDGVIDRLTEKWFKQ